MNERDRLIEQLIRERGGTKEQYLRLLNAVAFHESGGTFDPAQEQIGGGPGRGKYQFEKGRGQGAKTAVNRTKNYYKDLGMDVPKWVNNLTKNKSVDVSKLSSQQQDILFLSNMRKHPKADYRNLWNGEQTIADFWANYHWAGPQRERGKMKRKFQKDLDRFSEAEKALEPKEAPAEMQIPEQPKDAVNIKQPNVIEDLIQKYSQGGALAARGFQDKALNSYNAGGRHEMNPHGGIPQGMGSNGKMNTVEQGESAYRFKDGKFIFSDRINIMANGGPTDPPKKEETVAASRDFVNNWYGSNITKARLSENLGMRAYELIEPVNQGLKNVRTAEIKYDQPSENEAEGAMYKNNTISFYKDPTPETSTHEFTHAMELDDPLSHVMRQRWGSPAKAIQEKTGLPFREAIGKEYGLNPNSWFGNSDIDEVIDHSRYLNTGGELYPRIMEIRKVLGVKPGQKIDDKMIKQAKEKTKNPLFKFYSDKQVKEMLNTLAANKSNKNYNNLV